MDKTYTQADMDIENVKGKVNLVLEKQETFNKTIEEFRKDFKTMIADSIPSINRRIDEIFNYYRTMKEDSDTHGKKIVEVEKMQLAHLERIEGIEKVIASFVSNLGLIKWLLGGGLFSIISLIGLIIYLTNSGKL